MDEKNINEVIRSEMGDKKFVAIITFFEKTSGDETSFRSIKLTNVDPRVDNYVFVTGIFGAFVHTLNDYISKFQPNFGTPEQTGKATIGGFGQFKK
mgnify:CR=1 FL=1